MMKFFCDLHQTIVDKFNGIRLTNSFVNEQVDDEQKMISHSLTRSLARSLAVLFRFDFLTEDSVDYANRPIINLTRHQKCKKEIDTYRDANWNRIVRKIRFHHRSLVVKIIRLMRMQSKEQRKWNILLFAWSWIDSRCSFDRLLVYTLVSMNTSEADIST